MRCAARERTTGEAIVTGEATVIPFSFSLNSLAAISEKSLLYFEAVV